MRLDDLPPKMRAQVEAQLGRDAERRRPRPTAVSRAAGMAWRCGSAGCPFATEVWAEAERHADAACHPRIECVL